MNKSVGILLTYANGTVAGCIFIPTMAREYLIEALKATLLSDTPLIRKIIRKSLKCPLESRC